MKGKRFKADQIIYRSLVALYFAVNTFSVVMIALLILAPKLVAFKIEWISFAYLEAKYGSSSWLGYLGGELMLFIISSITVLDYKYECLPPRTGYRYSLKITENVTKQIELDRRTEGVSGILLLLLLLLLEIGGFSTFTRTPFSIPKEIYWFIGLILVVVGAVYHVKSANLSKLDKQQRG